MPGSLKTDTGESGGMAWHVFQLLLVLWIPSLPVSFPLVWDKPLDSGGILGTDLVCGIPASATDSCTGAACGSRWRCRAMSGPVLEFILLSGMAWVWC